MSTFGILSNDGRAAMLISDSFNPYYYRGMVSAAERTAIGPYNRTANIAGKYYQGIFDGTVRQTAFQIVISGYYIIPRYSDTDLIFVEPYEKVGMAISRIEPVFSGGEAWKLEYSLYWDKALYNPSYPNLEAPLMVSNVMPYIPKFHIFSQFTSGMPPQERYGMDVFNSTGQRKYNSAMKPLKLKEVAQLNFPDTVTAYAIDRHPSVKAYTQHSWCARPMYCLPHVAQAVSEFRWADAVSRWGWAVSASSTIDYTFWGAYGGALLSNGNSSVASIWSMQATGEFGGATRSGSALFGLIPLGSSSTTSGSPPFGHSNANGTGLPMLVADVADYI